jgi:hypothetical protein
MGKKLIPGIKFNDYIFLRFYFKNQFNNQKFTKNFYITTQANYQKQNRGTVN